MRISDNFDRHRSMRINKMLRNISFSLAFISIAFAFVFGFLKIFSPNRASWTEFFITFFSFIIFTNLGMHFHVSFKRKD